MRTQEAIIELLEKEALPIAKIASHIGISEGYIRTTVKSMELTGMIEKVDDRLPYYYRIAPDKDALDRDAIKKRKKQLITNGEDNEGLMKLIKSTPKEQWPAVAKTLKIVAKAIEELEADGLLIDTL